MMKLGAFSVSLAVKNIKKSLAFYEKLGFSVFHGDIKQGWLILRNGETKIGLFQNMFEDNIMTFNPGWSANAEPIDDFTDVRDIQQSLKKAGVKLTAEADETTAGPANIMLTDPDGNTILIDQHV